MFHCLPNVIETKKTTTFFSPNFGHTREGGWGGEAKMESGHTFLRYFFLTLPLLCIVYPIEWELAQFGKTAKSAWKHI